METLDHLYFRACDPSLLRVKPIAVRHDRLPRLLRLCKARHIRVQIERDFIHDTLTVCKIATNNAVINNRLRGWYMDLPFRDSE